MKKERESIKVNRERERVGNCRKRKTKRERKLVTAEREKERIGVGRKRKRRKEIESW